jgi:hypothetical protein
VLYLIVVGPSWWPQAIGPTWHRWWRQKWGPLLNVCPPTPFVVFGTVAAIYFRLTWPLTLLRLNQFSASSFLICLSFFLPPRRLPTSPLTLISWAVDVVEFVLQGSTSPHHNGTIIDFHSPFCQLSHLWVATYDGQSVAVVLFRNFCLYPKWPSSSIGRFSQIWL